MNSLSRFRASTNYTLSRFRRVNVAGRVRVGKQPPEPAALWRQVGSDRHVNSESASRVTPSLNFRSSESRSRNGSRKRSAAGPRKCSGPGRARCESSFRVVTGLVRLSESAGSLRWPSPSRRDQVFHRAPPGVVSISMCTGEGGRRNPGQELETEQAGGPAPKQGLAPRPAPHVTAPISRAAEQGGAAAPTREPLPAEPSPPTPARPRRLRRRGWASG
jgi:hypothetical protein